MFDAQSLEAQLAVFFEEEIGVRGSPHDADMFRRGAPKGLARLVELLGKKLNERAARVNFSEGEKGNGGNANRLLGSGDSLIAIAQEMKKRKQREPEDYHWLIVGQLCIALASALDHIEQLQTNGQQPSNTAAQV